ncbi:uncharacterized protein J8A68_005611 [[Candida] subhashii]|uniref:Triacylglycerol lipase n=1 Tax=[Candida] subhashii TaxID=561895 RepID=A0A8J5Q625_9ASCO|nr:uncharacterized protein J8A68_005611 [[Candida] subhashii]KAG7660936.1 hypothetical protein J8A68_005611 [[Candida] subhashii]
MKIASILYFAANFVSLSLGAIVSLKPPSKDPFYTATDGFKDAKPGDILRIRKAPSKLSSSFFPLDVKNTWQLLVRSEDSFGNPNVFVTTIIEPYNSDPAKVLSYQTFEDSSNLDCAPSYGVLSGAALGTMATQLEMTLMVLALQKGYYVVTPDYEGPKATFTVGKQSGQAVLNSVRATLNSGETTGISNDAKVAMWGYSGGSLASSWAASLQPKYAPELSKNLIGAALGGFVTNITATAEATDGGIFAALIPNAMNGLANEYPEFRDKIFDEVHAFDKMTLEDGSELCLVPALFMFAYKEFLTGESPAFPKGFKLLEDEVISNTIDENSLINHSKDIMPEIPIFIYHGSFDMIVPINGAKDVYKIWCENDIGSLEFSEDLTSGHLTETIVGAPAAWTWIENRFDGKEAVKGCSHSVRLSNFLYPNMSTVTRDYFRGLYDAFSASPIGPLDKVSKKSQLSKRQLEELRNFDYSSLIH